MKEAEKIIAQMIDERAKLMVRIDAINTAVAGLAVYAGIEAGGSVAPTTIKSVGGAAPVVKVKSQRTHHHRLKLECIVCKRSFLAKRKDRKYCSTKCKHDY